MPWIVAAADRARDCWWRCVGRRRAARRLARRVRRARRVAGLVDFWRWGYDYGHDLDLEHAIIKVPGDDATSRRSSARKQLLNFHATSWPDVGGWIAIAVARRSCWVAAGCWTWPLAPTGRATARARMRGSRRTSALGVRGQLTAAGA